MSNRCVLVIPDSGPLISLYRAGLLPLLLSLDMPIILVDEIVAEVSSDRKYDQDNTIATFIEDHTDVISIKITDVGEDQVAKRRAGTFKPGTSMGEAAIADFMAKQLPDLVAYNESVLLLFEDGDVTGKRFILPRNVHLLSTVGMLKGLERCGLIDSADVILNEMVEKGRRFRDLANPVDLPTEEDSEWKPPGP